MRTLQLRLDALGFNPGAIDGDFGPLTDAIVREFQRLHNLVPDGVVGPKTRLMLGLDFLGQTSVVPGLRWLLNYEYSAEGYRTGGWTASGLIQGYDANVRVTQYVRPAEKVALDVMAEVESGKISPQQGAVKASGQRNELLRETRKKLTPGGRSFSEALKEEGKPLAKLLHKYSHQALEESSDLMKRFGLKTLDPKSPLFDPAMYERAMEELGRSELVSKEVIKASGRTGKVVTAVAKFSRVAGPLGTGIGLALSSYEIAKAPEGQKAYVAGREASGFAGGLIGTVGGGLVAGWAASLVCGPAAPLCAIAVSVVVVGGASWAGSTGAELGYEQLMKKKASGKQPKSGIHYLGGGAYLDEKMIIRQGMGPKF